jgi:Predicted transcriptional regulators
MEYTISQLSKLAGVSSRTLRFYDETGLLPPKRIGSNGYRIYGQGEVDLLQQILFFRELGVPLDEIKKIVKSEDYNGTSALEKHLSELKERRERIETLIQNVEKTIAASKGESVMSDNEKFEGFKKKIIENDVKYGKEAREKYGDTAIDASNNLLMNCTPEEYAKISRITEEMNTKLKLALEQGDPSSGIA